MLTGPIGGVFSLSKLPYPRMRPVVLPNHLACSHLHNTKVMTAAAPMYATTVIAILTKCSTRNGHQTFTLRSETTLPNRELYILEKS